MNYNLSCLIDIYNDIHNIAYKNRTSVEIIETTKLSFLGGGYQCLKLLPTSRSLSRGVYTKLKLKYFTIHVRGYICCLRRFQLYF